MAQNSLYIRPWPANHSQPRNHLPRDTAMALMDHMKSNDAERRQAQRYAQELQLGETPTSQWQKGAKTDGCLG